MMELKMRYFINTHKVLTPIFILSCMKYYDNMGIGPLIYFALHGSYCVNWGLKELIFPDKSFEEVLSPGMFILGSVGVTQYWWAPWIVISKQTDPNNVTIFVAVVLNLLGTFLHYCSDAQKYYMLAEKKRLIKNGFFKRSRNINYFGEIITYLGFAMLAEHYLPILLLTLMTIGVYFPNMLKKDRSLSRYDDFKEYTKQSNMLTPKFS